MFGYLKFLSKFHLLLWNVDLRITSQGFENNFENFEISHLGSEMTNINT